MNEHKQMGRQKPLHRGVFVLLFVWISAMGATLAEASFDLPPERETPVSAQLPADEQVVYLPLVQAQQPPPATPVPTTEPIQPAPAVWDSRLDQRGIVVSAADVAPGQTYWRLVSGVWYDEQEAGGRHHTWVDLIDEETHRMIGVPVRFYWKDGEVVRNTEAKPGEPYAADFDMYAVAPAYGVGPHDGRPAEGVWGMGLGSIEQPLHTIHTSYKFIWQLTVYEATAEPTATPTPDPTEETPTPTTVPTTTPPDREWDPRLDQRGAVLQEATVTPGQGYWKLVRGVWYDEVEAGGRHHVFVDVRNADGNRIVNVPVRVYWESGHAHIQTQAKPGELYAADFGMSVRAPAYGAFPDQNDEPADKVWGMGLGSIEQPFHTIHTSYGLVWQWTIAPDPPTATATPTPEETTPTPTTPTPSPTAETTYLFNRAELVSCAPNAGVTYVEGRLRLDGQPANGYRVVFSWSPDGEIVAGITSGPHAGYEGWDPGFYSHILQTGGPREGDWWFWIVDEQENRISQMAHVHTHGVAGEGHCQQAVINFDSE
jgi:hypothetical protein